MKSSNKIQKLHSGEDTPICSQKRSSRYNLRPRKGKQSYTSQRQDSTKKRIGKKNSTMDLGLAKPMDTTLPKGDNCEVFGNKYPNDNTRIVTEAARNEVTTPQVNDRSPKSFAHSTTKPKRILPPKTRKATLNLPSVSSSA